MDKKIKVDFSRNVPDWVCSETDYNLSFCEVGNCETGYYWRECSHNVPKYNDILLSDYLNEMGVVIPDYCQFCRIISDVMHFEYRAYGGRVRIDVTLNS